ncbi:MAG TPA: helix-turn-helix transcriptional regulator [Planctomycetota bacterium]|nr:helix-turn-helix transcriptional regulator [Planctomycetota bacterium]
MNPLGAPKTDPWDGVSVVIRHANLYVCPPSWKIEPVTAQYDNLFYVMTGVGWMDQAGVRLEGVPGDLFISRRGHVVASGHDPKNPYTVYSTGFHLYGTGRSDALRFARLPFRVRVPKEQRAEVESRYAALVADTKAQSPTGMLSARGSLLRLFALALKLVESLPDSAKAGTPAPLPGDQTRAADAIAFIDAHLAGDLGLEKLAKHAHLSPVYFAKLFREQTGMAPAAFVRQRRMDVARSMLATSDETIERIARAVGFKDPFHFSRVFKKSTGIAPTEFRRLRFRVPSSELRVVE